MFKFDQSFTLNSKNIMDQWILAATENLVRQVRMNMEKYDLSASLPKLVQFLYQLTNWYVRLNR
jgi:isoleucyl-tRNA synthetase